MTQIAFRSTGDYPMNMEVGAALHLGDDELFELCARNPELRIERSAKGDLIVSPTGWASGRRNAKILGPLIAWAERDGRGEVTESSAGFRLPNGAVRAPDAAWILGERLAGLGAEAKERFLPACPDFVVELRSPSDDLRELLAKMEEYRASGARLGWMIDPQERRVHVYRPGREVEVLDGPDQVSGDPELPGFVLDLAPVWEPV